MTLVGMAARRELWLLLAVPTGVLGLLLAAVLSRPVGHPASDYPRLLALLAGTALLGCCLVSYLEQPRHRPALAMRLWRVQLVIAAVWITAELVLLVADAAEASSASFATVRPATVLDYAQLLVGGRVSVVVLGCVGAALVVLAVARGPVWSTASVLALGVVAVLARPLTGHAQIGVLAQLSIGAHVLAATLWCGRLWRRAGRGPGPGRVGSVVAALLRTGRRLRRGTGGQWSAAGVAAAGQRRGTVRDRVRAGGAGQGRRAARPARDGLVRPSTLGSGGVRTPRHG